MAFLQNMSPGTKRLLLVGVPIVAVIAFVVLVKNKSSTSSTTSTTGTTGSTTVAPYPGTAVDTGQLAAYESSITDQLAQIQSALAPAATVDGSSPTPAATPATPSPSAPSVGPQFGSGFGPTAAEVAGAPVPSLAGTSYLYVQTPAQAGQIAAAAGTPTALLNETEPGVFVPAYTAAGQPTGVPGTAEYVAAP